MGLRARKIHALSLLFILAAVFGSGAFLLAQDLSSGSHTVVKRYILPRYSNNGKLQCVIYGTQAINEGSLIRLAFTPHPESGRDDDDKVAVMIDFVDGSAYSSISQIETVKPNQVYPSPYKLGARERIIQEWWKRARHKHSQAWIFIEKTKLNAVEENASDPSTKKSSDSAVVVAVFDKSTNILTSDETAFFRSRQLDADGVGFDAFSDRKFIHIRSNVRAVLHFKDDKKQAGEDHAPEEEEQGLGTLFSSDSPADVRSDSADIDLENNIITLIGNVVVDDTKNKITCDKMVITLEDDAADDLIGSAEKPEEDASGDDPEEAPDGETGADDEEDDDDEDDEAGSIRKIECIGNVVCTMRDGSGDQSKEQIALCEQAEYDVAKRIVVMTGAHSAPANVIPENVYGVMERQVRKNVLAKSPVMMQDEDWMVGETFTILIKEKNRLKVDDIKVNYTGSIMSMKDEDKEDSRKKTDDGGDKNATLISADSADINIEQNFILLRGNVDIDDQSTKITCQEMEIRLNGDEKSAALDDNAAAEKTDESNENLFGNKDVSKVICKTDVVYMERPKPDDPDGENRIAMSDRADYDAVKETILMTGSPVVMQGTNKMHGETIEILSKEDNRVIVSMVKARLAGRLLSSDEEDVSGVGSTTITASTADFRPNDKITLSKNVVIDDGSGRITCSEMDIFLQKDSSNSLFTSGKQTKKGDDNTEDGDDLKNDVTKIVCSGNVVYRKQSDGQEQVVLARTADYDAVNEIIVMSGAHTEPQGEVSDETYAEIKRALSKETTASGGSVFEQYSILMQGNNWIAGNPITIHPKEGNRLKATDMKAALRRSSRSGSANGEER